MTGYDVTPTPDMSDLFMFVEQETKRQENGVNLIASENRASNQVMRLAGTSLMNKYAEGYPSERYYGGCEYIDKIECQCQMAFKKAFDTGYAVNVQPHSGSQANLAALFAVKKYRKLERPLKILSLSITDGGHLTHGSTASFIGNKYSGFAVVEHYSMNADGYIDYEDMERKAKEFHPDVIICGGSAYYRLWNWATVRFICNKYDALMMADIAHYAGLIAADMYPSPLKDAGKADIVTMTTHKTFRGARGGVIFSKNGDLKFSKAIQSALFPGIQGGAHMNLVAAKCQSALEAQTREFREYAFNVIHNARTMAHEFRHNGYPVVTGGTDCHMFLLDLSEKPFSGATAQRLLEDKGIYVNKNMIPGDTKSPKATSGIRIGTAYMTTAGWDSNRFKTCAYEIMDILNSYGGK